MEHLSVVDLVPHTRHLVTTSAANTVKDFLETLSKTQFTSLPLFKFPENKFIGFVDCLDVATFLCEIATQSSTAHPGSEPSSSLKTDDLENLFRRGHHFNSHQLGDLVGRSGRHPPTETIAGSAPLGQCIKMMSQGVHRLIVTGLGADHSGVNVITQSDVVQWLSQGNISADFYSRDRADTEKRLPKSKLTRTARELGWCDPERPVVTGQSWVVSSASCHFSCLYCQTLLSRLSSAPLIPLIPSLC
jgi:hypothetical protein